VSKRTRRVHSDHANTPNHAMPPGGRADDEAELYDDDISRKAVGRLFNEEVRIDSELDEEEYDEDFDDEYEDEPVAEAPSRPVPSREDPDVEYKRYIESVSQGREERYAAPPPQREVRRDATKSPVYKKVTAERERIMPKTVTASRVPSDGYDDYDSYSGVARKPYPQKGFKGFVAALSINDLKLILAGIGFVILIIFCVLIIMINARGADINRLKVSLEESKDAVAQKQSLMIENANLQSKHDALQLEVDRLTAENDLWRSESETGGTGDGQGQVDQPDQPDPGTGTGNGAGNGTGGGQTPAPGGRYYTVVSGDSLWSIAVNFYGDGNRYTEIKNANNITNDSGLQVGDVLLIP